MTRTLTLRVRELPTGLLLPDARELVFGFRLRDEIIHPRFRGDGSGGKLVIAGNHHRPHAHLAKLRETFPDAAFDDVLEMNYAEQPVFFRDDERRAAGA
jgi:hypothetical protein